MSINASDLRKGDVILHQNKLWMCLQTEHRTPGNLRAFVQAKLRNVTAGQQMDMRFSTTEKIEKVDLFERQVQFLYSDGTTYHFMDTQSYEQFEVGKDFLENKTVFLSDGMNLHMTFYENTPILLKLPTTMDFEIVEADPEIRTATASAQYKSAKLENGLDIKVPSFVKVGDRVKINTDSLEYVERVKK